MSFLRTTLVLGTAAVVANAQTLLDAIKPYSELSNFSALYTANEGFARTLITDPSVRHTLLIPSNDAFAQYEQDNGKPIAAADPDVLLSLFQYHIMVGEHADKDFSVAKGVTVPTLLTEEKYNNRSAGSALADSTGGSDLAKGQVVIVTSDLSSGGSHRARQNTKAYTVRSGMASDVTMTAIDGVWNGGKFQIVNRFLTLPEPCSDTIRHQNLTGLDQALNRTNLWDTLDHLANVTCLGPDNKAFQDAGSPDAKLNPDDLTKALLFHTIGQPLYSTFLSDGLTFTAMNNDTIRVSIRGDDIYFNDAKIVNPNVLTNNGLMHVLDRVMTPNGTPPVDGTTATTPSPTSSPSPTGSKAAAAGIALPRILGFSGVLGSLLFVL